jgi:hypothetical protein
MPKEKIGDPWEFQVCPGVFDLVFSVVHQSFRRYMDRKLTEYKKGIIKPATGAFREYQEDIEFMRWLDEQSAGTADAMWNENFERHAYRFVGDAIEKGEFVRVYCLSCDKSYVPTDVVVKRWVHSREFEGGRVALCMNGHIIYACVDWIRC